MKSKWPADKVERRKVADLMPYAKNSRTHSDRQVEQIAASINEWGWTVPVLIDENGGIIAGHGRVMAARKLKLKDVPVMVASGWSDEQKRAYVIADNKLTENGGWDDGLLREELRDLGEAGFSLDLVGFDDKEFVSFLARQNAEPLEEFPALPDGDKSPFQQMTFTLHDDQAKLVSDALELAKAQGSFSGPNENGNGNAIARICEAFLADHADS